MALVEPMGLRLSKEYQSSSIQTTGVSTLELLDCHLSIIFAGGSLAVHEYKRSHFIQSNSDVAVASRFQVE